MPTLTPELLLARLPALYRVRDAAQGGPLAALLAVAAEQGAIVEEDIQRLLDNLFIETCEEWVVPYLGDLLGVRGLHAVPTRGGASFSQRARVANTLSHRRRKGTLAMLEQLGRDTTGWPARGVEFFQNIGWNQAMNHRRPQALRTPDLRDTAKLELQDTAFEATMRTVDIRRISSGRGRHNLPSVGIFLWRLQAYRVADGLARPVAGGTGYHTFDPAGREIPLHNPPRTEVEIVGLAAERNLPGPLRRRPLYDELESHRASPATTRLDWFDPAAPVFRVWHRPVGSAQGTPFVEIGPEQIAVNQARRLLDPASPGYAAEPADHPVGAGVLVAVDPLRGLLRWTGPGQPPELRVAYAYAAPGDLGGGPYDRRESVEAFLGTKAAAPRTATFHVGVSREKTSVSGETIHETLADAVAAWETHAANQAGAVGIIALMDSHNQEAGLTIRVPAGCRLLIVASDWPVTEELGVPSRKIGLLAPTGLRPCLEGDLEIACPYSAQEGPGEIALDGVLLKGRMTIAAATQGTACDLGLLRLAHCTLLPSAGGIEIAGGNARLNLVLERTICGRVLVASDPQLPQGALLTLTDSILDAPDVDHALDAPQCPVEADSITVIGASRMRTLQASDSIFTARVNAARRQEGCVRFSHIPEGSSTGRRYRCQPDLAQAADPSDNDARVAENVRPAFASQICGQPAYCQLAAACAPELAGGASDGSEMGAWRFLQNPARLSNLAASLDEYLPIGLEAGPILAT